MDDDDADPQTPAASAPVSMAAGKDDASTKSTTSESGQQHEISRTTAFMAAAVSVDSVGDAATIDVDGYSETISGVPGKDIGPNASCPMSNARTDESDETDAAGMARADAAAHVAASNTSEAPDLVQL